MNGNILVKCEPVSKESELFNSLVADGQDDMQQQQQQQSQQCHQQELRFLCLYKLKVAEETVEILEAQQINVECLRKMRIEDVDVLFDGKPLGWKILFREAFLEWREEIGLPCKSIKTLYNRKRSSESYETQGENQSATLAHWDDCFTPSAQLFLAEKEAPEEVQQLENSALSNQTIRWPMTPATLKEVLYSTTVGRSILSRGCLGVLGKSLQYQLTAIVIDYHMAYETKITSPELENYAHCITTLLPHETAATYHIPRGPNRRNPGGSLYSRFINQKISKKALAIGNSIAAS
ncbi:uncharacterized protein LOC126562726 [Anopheles maculipalpis]|uniref:uncharacterized protein LOC126562726 n=1 Tax=Anopheles maculipalpis TaxID=1496333 RepID=UPI002158F3F2|nr:uncharacterized protein LOC126562726 [Anopheles maculipalpis]